MSEIRLRCNFSWKDENQQTWLKQSILFDKSRALWKHNIYYFCKRIYLHFHLHFGGRQQCGDELNGGGETEQRDILQNYYHLFKFWCHFVQIKKKKIRHLSSPFYGRFKVSSKNVQGNGACVKWAKGTNLTIPTAIVDGSMQALYNCGCILSHYSLSNVM